MEEGSGLLTLSRKWRLEHDPEARTSLEGKQSTPSRRRVRGLPGSSPTNDVTWNDGNMAAVNEGRGGCGCSGKGSPLLGTTAAGRANAADPLAPLSGTLAGSTGLLSSTGDLRSEHYAQGVRSPKQQQQQQQQHQQQQQKWDDPFGLFTPPSNEFVESRIVWREEPTLSQVADAKLRKQAQTVRANEQRRRQRQHGGGSSSSSSHHPLSPSNHPRNKVARSSLPVPAFPGQLLPPLAVVEAVQLTTLLDPTTGKLLAATTAVAAALYEPAPPPPLPPLRFLRMRRLQADERGDRYPVMPSLLNKATQLGRHRSSGQAPTRNSPGMNTGQGEDKGGGGGGGGRGRAGEPAPLLPRQIDTARRRAGMGNPPAFTLAEADRELAERATRLSQYKGPPPVLDPALARWLQGHTLLAGLELFPAWGDRFGFAGLTSLQALRELEAKGALARVLGKQSSSLSVDGGGGGGGGGVDGTSCRHSDNAAATWVGLPMGAVRLVRKALAETPAPAAAKAKAERKREQRRLLQLQEGEERGARGEGTASSLLLAEQSLYAPAGAAVAAVTFRSAAPPTASTAASTAVADAAAGGDAATAVMLAWMDDDDDGKSDGVGNVSGGDAGAAANDSASTRTMLRGARNAAEIPPTRRFAAPVLMRARKKQRSPRQRDGMPDNATNATVPSSSAGAAAAAAAAADLDENSDDGDDNRSSATSATMGDQSPSSSSSSSSSFTATTTATTTAATAGGVVKAPKRLGAANYGAVGRGTYKPFLHTVDANSGQQQQQAGGQLRSEVLLSRYAVLLSHSYALVLVFAHNINGRLLVPTPVYHGKGSGGDVGGGGGGVGGVGGSQQEIQLPSPTSPHGDTPHDANADNDLASSPLPPPPSSSSSSELVAERCLELRVYTPLAKCATHSIKLTVPKLAALFGGCGKGELLRSGKKAAVVAEVTKFLCFDYIVTEKWVRRAGGGDGGGAGGGGGGDTGARTSKQHSKKEKGRKLNEGRADKKTTTTQQGEVGSSEGGALTVDNAKPLVEEEGVGSNAGSGGEEEETDQKKKVAGKKKKPAKVTAAFLVAQETREALRRQKEQHRVRPRWRQTTFQDLEGWDVAVEGYRAAYQPPSLEKKMKHTQGDETAGGGGGGGGVVRAECEGDHLDDSTSEEEEEEEHEEEEDEEEEEEEEEEEDDEGGVGKEDGERQNEKEVGVKVAEEEEVVAALATPAATADPLMLASTQAPEQDISSLLGDVPIEVSVVPRKGDWEWCVHVTEVLRCADTPRESAAEKRRRRVTEAKHQEALEKAEKAKAWEDTPMRLRGRVMALGLRRRGLDLVVSCFEYPDRPNFFVFKVAHPASGSRFSEVSLTYAQVGALLGLPLEVVLHASAWTKREKSSYLGRVALRVGLTTDDADHEALPLERAGVLRRAEARAEQDAAARVAKAQGMLEVQRNKRERRQRRGTPAPDVLSKSTTPGNSSDAYAYGGGVGDYDDDQAGLEGFVSVGIAKASVVARRARGASSASTSFSERTLKETDAFKDHPDETAAAAAAAAAAAEDPASFSSFLSPRSPLLSGGRSCHGLFPDQSRYLLAGDGSAPPLRSSCLTVNAVEIGGKVSAGLAQPLRLVARHAARLRPQRVAWGDGVDDGGCARLLDDSNLLGVSALRHARKALREASQVAEAVANLGREEEDHQARANDGEGKHNNKNDVVVANSASTRDQYLSGPGGSGIGAGKGGKVVGLPLTAAAASRLLLLHSTKDKRGGGGSSSRGEGGTSRGRVGSRQAGSSRGHLNGGGSGGSRGSSRGRKSLRSGGGGKRGGSLSRERSSSGGGRKGETPGSAAVSSSSSSSGPSKHDSVFENGSGSLVSFCVESKDNEASEAAAAAAATIVVLARRRGSLQRPRDVWPFTRSWVAPAVACAGYGHARHVVGHDVHGRVVGHSSSSSSSSSGALSLQRRWGERAALSKGNRRPSVLTPARRLFFLRKREGLSVPSCERPKKEVPCCVASGAAKLAVPAVVPAGGSGGHGSASGSEPRSSGAAAALVVFRFTRMNTTSPTGQGEDFKLTCYLPYGVPAASPPRHSGKDRPPQPAPVILLGKGKGSGEHPAQLEPQQQQQQHKSQQQRQQQQRAESASTVVGVGSTIELRGVSWDQLLLLNRKLNGSTDECRACLAADPPALRALAVEVAGELAGLDVRLADVRRFVVRLRAELRGCAVAEALRDTIMWKGRGGEKESVAAASAGGGGERGEGAGEEALEKKRAKVLLDERSAALAFNRIDTQGVGALTMEQTGKLLVSLGCHWVAGNQGGAEAERNLAVAILNGEKPCARTLGLKVGAAANEEAAQRRAVIVFTVLSFTDFIAWYRGEKKKVKQEEERVQAMQVAMAKMRVATTAKLDNDDGGGGGGGGEDGGEDGGGGGGRDDRRGRSKNAENNKNAVEDDDDSESSDDDDDDDDDDEFGQRWRAPREVEWEIEEGDAQVFQLEGRRALLRRREYEVVQGAAEAWEVLVRTVLLPQLNWALPCRLPRATATTTTTAQGVKLATPNSLLGRADAEARAEEVLERVRTEADSRDKILVVSAGTEGGSNADDSSRGKGLSLVEEEEKASGRGKDGDVGREDGCGDANGGDGSVHLNPLDPRAAAVLEQALAVAAQIEHLRAEARQKAAEEHAVAKRVKAAKAAKVAEAAEAEALEVSSMSKAEAKKHKKKKKKEAKKALQQQQHPGETKHGGDTGGGDDSGGEDDEDGGGPETAAETSSAAAARQAEGTTPPLAFSMEGTSLLALSSLPRGSSEGHDAKWMAEPVNMLALPLVVQGVLLHMRAATAVAGSPAPSSSPWLQPFEGLASSSSSSSSSPTATLGLSAGNDDEGSATNSPSSSSSVLASALLASASAAMASSRACLFSSTQRRPSASATQQLRPPALGRYIPPPLAPLYREVFSKKAAAAARAQAPLASLPPPAGATADGGTAAATAGSWKITNDDAEDESNSAEDVDALTPTPPVCRAASLPAVRRRLEERYRCRTPNKARRTQHKHVPTPLSKRNQRLVDTGELVITEDYNSDDDADDDDEDDDEDDEEKATAEKEVEKEGGGGGGGGEAEEVVDPSMMTDEEVLQASEQKKKKDKEKKAAAFVESLRGAANELEVAYGRREDRCLASLRLALDTTLYRKILKCRVATDRLGDGVRYLFVDVTVSVKGWHSSPPSKAAGSSGTTTTPTASNTTGVVRSSKDTGGGGGGVSGGEEEEEKGGCLEFACQEPGTCRVFPLVKFEAKAKAELLRSFRAMTAQNIAVQLEVMLSELVLVNDDHGGNSSNNKDKIVDNVSGNEDDNDEDSADEDDLSREGDESANRVVVGTGGGRGAFLNAANAASSVWAHGVACSFGGDSSFDDDDEYEYDLSDNGESEEDQDLGAELEAQGELLAAEAKKRMSMA